MTVKDLKKAIKNLPDDTPVCIWDDYDTPEYLESTKVFSIRSKYWMGGIITGDKSTLSKEKKLILVIDTEIVWP